MPKFNPISISNYPHFSGKMSIPCLGFALGEVKPIMKNSSKYNLDDSCSIGEAFLKKISELEIEITLRQINSVDEAIDGEYIFMVIGFTKYWQYNFIYGDYIPLSDFHVLRRELDGSWVHKPGWDDDPCEIKSQADWDSIFQEFGSKYVLFAAPREA